MDSIKIWLAVSFLMAKCEPFILRYMGSEKEEIATNSTELPGKQPISNNLSGISLAETSIITACCPRFKSANVNLDLFRIILKKQK